MRRIGKSVKRSEIFVFAVSDMQVISLTVFTVYQDSPTFSRLWGLLVLQPLWKPESLPVTGEEKVTTLFNNDTLWEKYFHSFSTEDYFCLAAAACLLSAAQPCTLSDHTLLFCSTWTRQRRRLLSEYITKNLFLLQCVQKSEQETLDVQIRSKPFEIVDYFICVRHSSLLLKYIFLS